MKRIIVGVAALGVLAGIAIAVAAVELPAVGAGALLYPTRNLNRFKKPDACVDRTFAGVDVTLRGWQCSSTIGEHKGTVIFLHGVGDSRGGALGAIQTFLPL